MRRGRQQHLGATNGGAIPICLHRQQDRLGAARSHIAHDLVTGFVAAQHCRRHRNDLGLELRARRPQIRVQRVGLGVQGVGLVEKADVSGIAVVYGTRGPSGLPVGLLRGGEFRQFGDDLRSVATAFGQVRITRVSRVRPG